MDEHACSEEPATRQLACLIPAERIAARVAELADRISEDYEGRPLLVVGVLKGAWVFLADLVRHLRLPLHCDFVRISSYGMGMQTSGDPQMLLDATEPIEGRDVLIVDDILDTGISIDWLCQHFRAQQPRSLRLCVLLDKPSRRRVPIVADYTGFEIPDQFVVGYGIDCAEEYRELPYLAYVVSDEADCG